MNDGESLQLFYSTLVLAMVFPHLVWKMRHVWTLGSLDVAIWFSGLFFGFGPWFAMIAGGELMYGTGRALTAAYLSVIFFLAGLMLVQYLTAPRRLVAPDGTAVHPLSRLARVIESVSRLNLLSVLVWFGVIWFQRGLVAVQYGIWFSGTGTGERQLSIPYPIVILRSITLLLSYGVVMYASTNLWMRRWRLPSALLFLAELGYNFTQGRREMLGTLLIAAIAYVLVKGRILVRYLIGSAVVGYVAWVWLMPAFFGIRTLLLVHQSGSPLQDLITAASEYAQGRQDTEISSTYRKNIAARPLIVNFNITIAEAQDAYPWMMGRAIAQSFLITVPRALFPDYKDVTAAEQYILTWYGQGEYDAASNWPAYGLADFGPMGGLFAGVLFGGLIALSELVAYRVAKRMPLVGLSIVGCLIFSGFQVEQPPEQMFGTVRDSLLLIVVMFVVSPLLPRPALDAGPDAALDPAHPPAYA